MDTDTIAAPPRPRGPSDLLTYREAHEQYPGSPKPSTMSIWLCTGRYPEFTAIVTYLGGRPRIRRDKWEALLERGFGHRQRKLRSAA